MTEPCVLLAATGILSAFFYAVKTVFSLVWENAEANPERFRTRAARRCMALQKDRDRFDLSAGLGTILFSAFFLLSALWLCRSRGLMPAAVSLRGALCLVGAAAAFMVLCRTAPKTLAGIFAERLIAPCYYAYRAWAGLVLPLVLLSLAVKKGLYRVFHYEEKLAFLSESQRLKLKARSNGGGDLNPDEREMIYSIFTLRETEAREIMVPRTDLVAVEENDPAAGIVEVINQSGHTRIPVYRKNIDNIVGILNVKDLLKIYRKDRAALEPPFTIAPLLRQPYYVPLNKKINGLFQELRREKVHLAVVIDEYGGTSGIITLEDILEEIVGEIHDEYDKVEEIYKRISRGVIEADPKIDIEKLNEVLGTGLNTDDPDYSTLGGLILARAGKIPKPGDVLSFEDLKVTVLQMDGNRMEKVKVERF